MSDLKIALDDRLSSYEGYLPDGWIDQEPFKGVKHGCVLEILLYRLGLSWRTTAYVAAVPSMIVKMVQSALLGFAKVESPDASLIGFGEGVLAKLSRQVPELVEDRKLRAKLMIALVAEADLFRKTAAAVALDLPLEPMWRDFLDKHAFAMTVWASQQVAYVSFYNAYEAFLVDCMKHVLQVGSLRASDKSFLDGLRTAFGKDLTGPCWNHHELHIGREVRHSLSHGGGKPTAKLKKHKHGIVVEGGVLQIWPDDNRKLLSRLLKAVGTFAKEGAGNAHLGIAAI